MKTKIITIVLILLAGSMLTSCDRSNANENLKPPAPNPIKVLEEKVESERQLRQEAESLAAEEAASKGNWQLAALGLCLLAVIAFFGGTSIGTRGRYHAGTAS